MPAELKAPIRVSLDRLFLDPNNPRLAATEKPGYAASKEEQRRRLRHGG